MDLTTSQPESVSINSHCIAADGDHNFPLTGSILVFLPGLAEITTLYENLSRHPVLGERAGKFKLIPLHSSLSSEQQAQVRRLREPHIQLVTDVMCIYVLGFRVIQGLSCVIGPLGRQGLAATLGQHCPQMTKIPGK